MRDRINLNADMGEGYDAADEVLLGIVRTANVACGAHAGDARVMRRISELSVTRGASIGAHPGFEDREHFGRRDMEMTSEQIEALVAGQIETIRQIAREAGTDITHVKAHGALSNMAAVREDYASAICRAVKAADPGLIYLATAGTKMCDAARVLGLRLAEEGFADRSYEEDGTLTPRSMAGAVLSDPVKAARQAVRLAIKGEVVTRTGKIISLPVQSLCVHGDEPTAIDVAKTVRAALEAEGLTVAPLTEMGL
ncbi:MAG: 5-oxoprolinase subunit PxpA [Pseudomonadota bacterium]|nr:5-oxoprolinase subunit PxpA [Pseudomonadota bacterium]